MEQQKYYVPREVVRAVASQVQMTGELLEKFFAFLAEAVFVERINTVRIPFGNGKKGKTIAEIYAEDEKASVSWMKFMTTKAFSDKPELREIPQMRLMAQFLEKLNGTPIDVQYNVIDMEWVFKCLNDIGFSSEGLSRFGNLVRVLMDNEPVHKPEIRFGKFRGLTISEAVSRGGEDTIQTFIWYTKNMETEGLLEHIKAYLVKIHAVEI